MRGVRAAAAEDAWFAGRPKSVARRGQFSAGSLVGRLDGRNRSTYNGRALAYYVRVADVKAKVTRNGQISLPAELRHRWRSVAVLVIDRGSYAIVRPIPDDVVTDLRGAHAGPGPTSEQTRAAERARDEEAASSRLSTP